MYVRMLQSHMLHFLKLCSAVHIHSMNAELQHQARYERKKISFVDIKALPRGILHWMFYQEHDCICH